jgi:retinol dehydrogenase-12
MQFTELDKLVVVITGCTNGIGKATVKNLCKQDRVGRIIMGNRNEKLAAELMGELDLKNTTVHQISLDLASLSSVGNFAGKVSELVDKVHVLICNGGVGGIDGVTRDGFEMQFGVNTLSHFLLTELLQPLLLNAQPMDGHFYPRVINVSSEGSFSSKGIKYDTLKPLTSGKSANLAVMFDRYASSKLAQIMLGRHLSRRLNSANAQPDKIAVMSLHPGFVYTNGFSNAPRWIGMMMPVVWAFLRPFGAILKDEEGCLTTIHLTLDSDADLDKAYNQTTSPQTGKWFEGGYFDVGVGKTPTAIALDNVACEELYQKCLEWSQ